MADNKINFRPQVQPMSCGHMDLSILFLFLLYSFDLLFVCPLRNYVHIKQFELRRLGIN